LRQENHEFWASLGCIKRISLKNFKYVFMVKKFHRELDVVVHICNLNSLGGRDRRSSVKASPGKSSSPHLKKKKRKGLGLWLKW
jgi:hypothetical protein